jgi:hypothetical protein
MYDMALKKRIVALVIAALLSVAGASASGAAFADDAQARTANSGSVDIGY